MHIKLICLYILFAVISFCTNSTSSSKRVYLDSSLVPEYTYLMCFCNVTSDMEVDVTVWSLKYPDQLGIINDEKEFEISILNKTRYYEVGKSFQLRYTRYEHTTNTLCLSFYGNWFCFSSLFVILNVTQTTDASTR